MQVFLPYSNLSEVVTCLVKDKRRFNKQIIECGQIIAAIKGDSKAWSNHPIVWQYRDYVGFLVCYKKCLEGDTTATPQLPPFALNQEYLDSHKKRLYQKNPEAFAEFAEYDNGDTSNLYCVPLDFAVPKRKGVSVVKTFNEYKIVKYDNRTTK